MNWLRMLAALGIRTTAIRLRATDDHVEIEMTEDGRRPYRVCMSSSDARKLAASILNQADLVDESQNQ